MLFYFCGICKKTLGLGKPKPRGLLWIAQKSLGGCVTFLVQLHITEVQGHIDGDLDKVQEVEAPGQEEEETGAAVEELDEILGDAENVADPDENLELQGLALGGTGLPGLVDG